MPNSGGFDFDLSEDMTLPVTVLYPEARQLPDDLERGVFGADVSIVKRDTGALSELSDADCAAADGLMIGGGVVAGAALARVPQLRANGRPRVRLDDDAPPGP